MSQIKEAIELLEKLEDWLEKPENGCDVDNCWHGSDVCPIWCVRTVLAKLREPKCETCMCMDCGKVIKVTEQSKHLRECPKEPKCKTCGGTGEVVGCETVSIPKEYDKYPCPDCQQPPASDFTEDDAQQLIEIAPKIMHSKGCFRAFCEAIGEIRDFGRRCHFEDLTVALRLRVEIEPAGA